MRLRPPTMSRLQVKVATAFVAIVFALVALSLLGALLSTRVPYEGCVKIGGVMPLGGRCG